MYMYAYDILQFFLVSQYTKSKVQKTAVLMNSILRVIKILINEWGLPNVELVQSTDTNGSLN